MKRRSGLTLIEILVALAILAVGATAALSLLGAATGVARDAAMSARAALLAHSLTAELSAAYDLSVDLRALGAGEEREAPDSPGLRYKWELEPYGDRGEAVRVHLTMRWQAGSERVEEFYTLLRRRLRAADLKPLWDRQR